MRKLLAVILLILSLSTIVQAAAVRIQVHSNDNTSGTVTFIVTMSSTQAGNFIVVGVQGFSTGGTITSCTDNIITPTTYSVAYSLAITTNVTGAIFYKANDAGGVTSITCSVSSGNASTAIAAEYSGVATTSPLDAAVVALVQATATTFTSNTITTTSTSGDLLIGQAFTRSGANKSYAASGSWNFVVHQNQGTDNDDSMMEEQLNVASCSTCDAATGTSLSVSNNSGVAAFKLAATSTRKKGMLLLPKQK